MNTESKTTPQIIYQVVWKACDTFRGTMDSSQYKDYILSMLFVKYLSDFCKEKLQLIQEKYQGDAQRINRAIKREKFQLHESCTFEYLIRHKAAPNLGEIINKALEKIEEDNPKKLSGIFRNVDFNDKKMLGETKERHTLLKNLLEDFNDPRLNLAPSQLEGQDVLGDSYEFLIGEFASDAGKKGGEFFTPKEVSILLAKLIQAKEGSRIYDPTCGSGSLLIKAAKEIGNQHFTIYGQERNGQTHSLCRMNMYLHEINDAQIEWGDTIRNPLHLQDDQLMSFDVVVANPPFSLDKWGADDVIDDLRFQSYAMPPKSKGDYAFILHMIHSMNDNGRMAIVLPHGALFRGASEGKIRQKLIENNLLDAVIGLPPNLFFGTSIPACILLFHKNKTHDNILFIDASKDFQKGKNQNKLHQTHLEKILETYHNRMTIDRFSYHATLQEVQDNNYNLNIPRYVDCFEQENTIDIKLTQQQILQTQTELASLKSKMNQYLTELWFANDQH